MMNKKDIILPIIYLIIALICGCLIIYHNCKLLNLKDEIKAIQMHQYIIPLEDNNEKKN